MRDSAAVFNSYDLSLHPISRCSQFPTCQMMAKRNPIDEMMLCWESPCQPIGDRQTYKITTLQHMLYRAKYNTILYSKVYCLCTIFSDFRISSSVQQICRTKAIYQYIHLRVYFCLNVEYQNLFWKLLYIQRSGQILNHAGSCSFAQLLKNSHETVCWLQSLRHYEKFSLVIKMHYGSCTALKTKTVNQQHNYFKKK